MDFLVHIKVVGLAWEGDEVDNLYRLEAKRARELATFGILKRLWRIPGQRANWGIWSAPSADELHTALTSLPLFPYMEIQVHPLATHPNDPHRLPGT